METSASRYKLRADAPKGQKGFSLRLGKKSIALLGLLLAAPLSAQSNPITSITISLPANPDANMAVSESELTKPITFRWTPVLPRPTEPVTYRLRIWQLMQGQSGSQAMKTNQPIVTKDVDNITQAIVARVLSGPCKQPYLCDFVWNVQALNREGKPIGSNNGLSTTGRFAVRK